MSKQIGEGSQTGAALAAYNANNILALSSDGQDEFNQIIEENFGGAAVTLKDVDKIKIPAGGITSWSVIDMNTGEETEVKELLGIIIAWTDKKSWWAKSYGDSTGKEQPDCKSNDMVYGIGMPNKALNRNEESLIQERKANSAAREVLIPDTDGQRGFLCATCPHNVFGSAAQGKGKACQDKRFILFLPVDAVLPVLIRVPATSIVPIKEYFKRLAGQRTSYLGTVTSLGLVKIKAAKDYSQLVPKMVRKLTPEETAAVRKLRAPFQAALDADDAIEASYTDVSGETLDDMPTHTGLPDEADEPFNPMAKSLADLVTAKQLGMMRALAREKNIVADDECNEVMKCRTDELSKKAASAFIQHLQDSPVRDGELTSTEKAPVDSEAF